MQASEFMTQARSGQASLPWRAEERGQWCHLRIAQRFAARASPNSRQGIGAFEFGDGALLSAWTKPARACGRWLLPRRTSTPPIGNSRTSSTWSPTRFARTSRGYWGGSSIMDCSKSSLPMWERLRRFSALERSARTLSGRLFLCRTWSSVPVWNYFDAAVFRIIFTLVQKRGRFCAGFSPGTFVSGRSRGNEAQNETAYSRQANCGSRNCGARSCSSCTRDE